MERKIIGENIYYVGVNDYKKDLFEGQFIIPNGMAYNSYVIMDERIAVFDTVDAEFTQEWLGNLEEVLGDKIPEYLIVSHMEPDHSASIKAFVERYPNVAVVVNSKSVKMIKSFFPDMEFSGFLEVKDGERLDLGKSRLTFFFAPMVHWPEVMMTFEETSKTLFSADAFGKFGALDADEDWACEARRYYFGIVGKYGMQVQNVLKKLGSLEIANICALHGPILTENLEYYLNLYNVWSSYGVESKGVCVCYTSVYGNTKKAVEYLAECLSSLGVEKVAVNDLARCDMAEAVEDAFRYGKLILATTTYNAEIFPFMKEFIDNLLERNYQNRTIGFIENGSWAPMANKVMKSKFEKSKNITLCEAEVSILSALTQENKKQIESLAKEIACK